MGRIYQYIALINRQQQIGTYNLGVQVYSSLFSRNIFKYLSSYNKLLNP